MFAWTVAQPKGTYGMTTMFSGLHTNWFLSCRVTCNSWHRKICRDALLQLRDSIDATTSAVTPLALQPVPYSILHPIQMCTRQDRRRFEDLLQQIYKPLWYSICMCNFAHVWPRWNFFLFCIVTLKHDWINSLVRFNVAHISAPLQLSLTYLLSTIVSS